MGKTVDLTHVLKTGITVYPGTNPPSIEEVCSVTSEGYSERLITMYSHTGTHLDVPAHIFSDGLSITGLPADNFFGTALKLVVSNERPLTTHTIDTLIKKHGLPDFFLLQTGWDRYWESEKYFAGFPLPDSLIFSYLAGLKIKGIGIDTISVDPVESVHLANHHAILSQGKIIVENLTRLTGLPEGMFDFYCFPLKIEKGDGSPIRAIARIN